MPAPVENVPRALEELGVDIARLTVLPLLLAEWLEKYRVDGPTRIALLRMIEQGTIYAEEQVEGCGFREKATRIAELITQGDAEVAAELAKEEG